MPPRTKPSCPPLAHFCAFDEVRMYLFPARESCSPDAEFRRCRVSQGVVEPCMLDPWSEADTLARDSPGARRQRPNDRACWAGGGRRQLGGGAGLAGCVVGSISSAHLSAAEAGLGGSSRVGVGSEGRRPWPSGVVVRKRLEMCLLVLESGQIFRGDEVAPRRGFYLQ